MNPIAIRLLSGQLASPQFSQPGDIVEHFGAMQAQDYRMMRWAVVMRMRHPSAKAFSKAFAEGEIVRLHLLRGTWQIVSRRDYPWMLRLFSDKAERTVRGWMRQNGVSIGGKELHDVRDIMERECSKRGSATKENFATALAHRGVSMDGHRLGYHIRLAEISGTLCSGRLTPMRATYALSSGRVETKTEMEKDEMLARLTRKYFRSHSPASFEDFLWWSGLTRAECRRGMDALGAELSKEVWRGYEFFVHETCRKRGFRGGRLLLLPPFDEYLVGYKSRELVLPQAFAHRAHNKNGIFFPVVTYNGIVCGNWQPWEEELRTSFFLPVPERADFGRGWDCFSQIKKT